MKGKKRKFHGNRYVKVETLDDSEASKEKKIAETSTSNLTASSEVASSIASEFRSSPASKRELDCDLSSEEEDDCIDGFQLIGISILMSIFNTFFCPKCKSGHIVMKEDVTAKMGLVSQLLLECSAEMCSHILWIFIHQVG